MSKPKNAFTVDLEDWFQGNEYVSMDRSNEFEDRIDYSTKVLLDLLAEFKVSATFFILGHIAKNKSDLIRRIASAGHEIASHGYSHELIYRQTPEKFREELKASKSILEDISGHEVKGHRASNWTITEKSLWALDIIKAEGFKYDSSIFPTKNYLFGIPEAPRFAHRVSNGLLEIPPSTLRYFGKNIPFSGGFFLRAIPTPFLRWGIQQLNQQDQSAVIYIHPWELDPEHPRSLPIPMKGKFIHYYGIHSTVRKLRVLFSNFKFDRMDRVFDAEIKS